MHKEKYIELVKNIGDVLYRYIAQRFTKKILECEIFMFQEDLYNTNIKGDYLRSHSAIMLNYEKIKHDPYLIAKVLCEQFTQATMHKLGAEELTSKNSEEYNKLFKSIYLNICQSLGANSAGLESLTDKTRLIQIRH